MRKLVNGQYVRVDFPTPVTPAETPLAAGPKVVLASKAAQALMDSHKGVDFSGLVGTGALGLITKPDVQKFIESAQAA